MFSGVGASAFTAEDLSDPVARRGKSADPPRASTEARPIFTGSVRASCRRKMLADPVQRVSLGWGEEARCEQMALGLHKKLAIVAGETCFGRE